MKTYKITGKFQTYVVAHNKEEALDKAYEELDEATSGTEIETDVDEVELYDD